MQATADERNAHPVQRRCLPDHPLAKRHMLAFVVRLPSLRWPRHSFPRASLTSSPCMLISAYIFLSRWFSSNGAFIWLIIGASMPPYLDRDLYEVAALIRCPRHSQGTGTPFLCLAWYVYAFPGYESERSKSAVGFEGLTLSSTGLRINGKSLCGPRLAGLARSSRLWSCFRDRAALSVYSTQTRSPAVLGRVVSVIELRSWSI
jgi:hypothetical protein